MQDEGYSALGQLHAHPGRQSPTGRVLVVDIHLQYLGEMVAAEGISLVPFVGGIASIFAKAAAQAAYEQRLSNLKDDYTCIFAEADSELWIDYHYCD